MLTIHLHDIALRGFHGLYEEEKLLGNHFLIHLDIHLLTSEKINHISQTVDYSKAYEILNGIFQQPHELLETLAHNILQAIFSFDSKVVAAQITIIKKTPPIPEFQGNTGVTLALERKSNNS
jgi:dihydroneopterin aldolase